MESLNRRHSKLSRKSIKSDHTYTIKHKRLAKYLFVGTLGDKRDEHYGYMLEGELLGKPSKLAVREVLRPESNYIIDKEVKINE